MLIFAINLNVKKDDKKIDQLKSPLINQNIPKTGIFFDNNFIAGASILHGRHHEAKKFIA